MNSYWLSTNIVIYIMTTAGIIAREMGLPIKLISAVNSNDIVARTLTSGDYAPMVEVVNTLAPAMNIQVYVLLYMLKC